MSFVNGKGRLLGRMRMAARRPGGQESLVIPRAALYAALGELARSRGSEVTYGKQFVDVVPLPGGGVRARFADGCAAEGDLLVGCDGIHSPAHEIIDAAPGPMIGWATYDMPVVERWHNGRNMIIISDAAHATAPSAT